jgi:hypothetical protein
LLCQQLQQAAGSASVHAAAGSCCQDPMDREALSRAGTHEDCLPHASLPTDRFAASMPIWHAVLTNGHATTQLVLPRTYCAAGAFAQAGTAVRDSPHMQQLALRTIPAALQGLHRVLLAAAPACFGLGGDCSSCTYLAHHTCLSKYTVTSHTCTSLL